MSAAQQLQRFNEIYSKFYEKGSWRGVHTTVSLTSTSGIITLAEAYLRLDRRIAITTTGKRGFITIRSQQWQFQENGPGVFDVTLGGIGDAIDLGDNASGQRRYQLTGTVADLDALAFSGLARKRFVYITDTATVVVPDCYSALELAWKAMNASDQGANELSKDLWVQAFIELDSDLGEFEEGNEQTFIQIDRQCAVLAENLV